MSVCESSLPDPINKSVTLTGPGSVTLDMWEDDGGAQSVGLPVTPTTTPARSCAPTTLPGTQVGNGIYVLCHLGDRER